MEKRSLRKAAGLLLGAVLMIHGIGRWIPVETICAAEAEWQPGDTIVEGSLVYTYGADSDNQPYLSVAPKKGEKVQGSLRIPDTVQGIRVTQIGSFYQQNEITEVILGTSVKEMMSLAFSGCSSLKKFEMHGEVSRIPLGLLNSCSSLEEVWINRSVTAIDANVLLGSPEPVIYYEGTEAEWEKIEKYDDPWRNPKRIGFLNGCAHLLEENWRHDLNEHWKICSICGNKVKSADHTWEYQHHQAVCLECGYETEEINLIPKIQISTLSDERIQSFIRQEADKRPFEYAVFDVAREKILDQGTVDLAVHEIRIADRSINMNTNQAEITAVIDFDWFKGSMEDKLGLSLCQISDPVYGQCISTRIREREHLGSHSYFVIKVIAENGSELKLEQAAVQQHPSICFRQVNEAYGDPMEKIGTVPSEEELLQAKNFRITTAETDGNVLTSPIQTLEYIPGSLAQITPLEADRYGTIASECRIRIQPYAEKYDLKNARSGNPQAGEEYALIILYLSADGSYTCSWPNVPHIVCTPNPGSIHDKDERDPLTFPAAFYDCDTDRIIACDQISWISIQSIYKEYFLTDLYYGRITDFNSILQQAARTSPIMQNYELLEEYSYQFSPYLQCEQKPDAPRGIAWDRQGTAILYIRKRAESSKTSLKEAKISQIKEVYTWTGNPIEPKITVTLNGTKLRQNRDYTVRYENNTDVGTGMVRVDGMGEYEGSISREFTIEANKTLLNQAIKKAKAETEKSKWKKVHPIVQKKFLQALQQAQQVSDDPGASQEEVNAAWKNLSQMMQYLDFTADKANLEKLIVQAEIYENDLENYTGALEEFVQALNDARAVMENPLALDPSITEVYLRLEIAMNTLREKTAADDMLEDITEICLEADLSLYVDAGQEEFLAALEEAQDALRHAATDAQVEEALERLNEAWLSLRLKPDEELLNGLYSFVRLCDQIDASLYKPEELRQIKNTELEIETALKEHERKLPELDRPKTAALAEKAAESVRIIQSVQPGLYQTEQKTLSGMMKVLEDSDRKQIEQPSKSASVSTSVQMKSHQIWILQANAALLLAACASALRKKSNKKSS